MNLRHLPSWLPALCCAVLCFLMAAPQALGQGKTIQLRRLAERVPVDDLGNIVNESSAIGFNANPDVDAFKALSRDLGLVFAPRFLTPAETLGEAGFDVGFGASISTLDGAADHWRVLDSSPGVFTTGQIYVRKGLPFSFEFGGSLSHLFDSDMVAVGTELKWALNEGFLYLPDIAVRGSVNNIVGSSDLNLTNAGADVSISKAFAMAGVMSITPYFGYNRLWIISSSRLLDVAPDDPTPPEIEACDVNDVNCVEELRFQPEFVFGTEVQLVNRYFVGSRFIFGVATITLESAFSEGVQNYSGSVGFDF